MSRREPCDDSIHYGQRRGVAPITAKHDVVGLTQCLALYLALQGLRFGAVAPGAVGIVATAGLEASPTSAVLQRISGARAPNGHLNCGCLGRAISGQCRNQRPLRVLVTADG